MDEIENEISKLKSGKATGSFSISVDILKLLKSVLSIPLTILFNTSFSSGTVPNDLKLANVVSNLLVKLSPHLIALNFLDKHNVLFDKQFGFRSKHNTDHAIIIIYSR